MQHDALTNKTLMVAAIIEEARGSEERQDERRIVPESFRNNG
jgi:hypothetical protein